MAKTCRLCGEDCSNRPRVKDAQGRYFCKSCDDLRMAGQAASLSAAAVTDPEPPAAEPAPGDEPFELDDDAFELADPDPGASPLPIDMVDHAARTTSCPVCVRAMAPGTRICVSCGYDAEKGIQSSTKIEKSASRKKSRTRGYLCKSCGYDLTGLREPVCPECGSRVPMSRRERLDNDMRSQVFHEEYKKPLVWLAVALVIIAVALIIKGDPVGIVWYAALLVVQLPFMLIGLWVCQMTFLGQVGTIPLNTVRIASALAIGNAVDQLVPISFMFITPGTIIYVGVLMDLFDIDFSDAVGTAIVMFVTKAIATLLAIFVLVQYLGMAI